MTSVELLAPGERTSREVEADQIDQLIQAHGEVLRAGRDLIAAAARAGRVLLEVKRKYGEASGWRAWVETHLPFTYATARLYMMCAKHEVIIREQGWTKLNEVKQGLGGLIEPDHAGKGRGNRKPAWMKHLARDMHRDGERIAHIARDLGVSQSAVKCWVDPAYEAKARQRSATINKRRVRAEREMREREREQQIKLAVKKAGAVDAEAYAMAERFQDVLGQAHREASDREKRRHYACAGEHYRRMRDEIVRALGVT